MNLQLCFAYFQLFYVLSTIDLFDEFTGLALNLILFVDSTIIVITVCLLITRIDKALNGLCSAALSLSVSGKVLHEGVSLAHSDFIACLDLSSTQHVRRVLPLQTEKDFLFMWNVHN